MSKHVIVTTALIICGILVILSSNILGIINTTPLVLFYVELIIFLSFSCFIERKYNNLKHCATRDFLTNVYNRKFVYDIFPKLIAQIKRKNEKLTVYLIDCDNFKRINDCFGHQEGDSALKILSNILISNTRDTDVVARWGGDEFIIIAPFVDESSRNALIERLEKALEKEFYEGEKAQFSISIGAATLPDDAEDIDDLIKIADLNMYSIKFSKKEPDSLPQIIKL